MSSIVCGSEIDCKFDRLVRIVGDLETVQGNDLGWANDSCDNLGIIRALEHISGADDICATGKFGTVCDMSIDVDCKMEATDDNFDVEHNDM